MRDESRDQRIERRWNAALVRIGILVGVVALIVLTPTLLAFVSALSGDSAELAPLTMSPGYVRLSGNPVYLVQDQDGNGEVDCVKRIPWMPFLGTGWTAGADTRRCGGWRMKSFQAADRKAFTRLYRARLELGVHQGSLDDLDGDGRVDCIRHGVTYFRAEGYDCINPDVDVRPLDGERRRQASEALRLERKIRAAL